jgi:hypothetical protein
MIPRLVDSRVLFSSAQDSSEKLLLLFITAKKSTATADPIPGKEIPENWLTERDSVYCFSKVFTLLPLQQVPSTSF